jgi:hypothetical protein
MRGFSSLTSEEENKYDHVSTCLVNQNIAHPSILLRLQIFADMYVKLSWLLLVLGTIDVTSTATLEADALIRSVCVGINQNTTLKVQEDRQWQRICQELYQFQGDHLQTDVDGQYQR